MKSPTDMKIQMNVIVATFFYRTERKAGKPQWNSVKK